MKNFIFKHYLRNQKFLTNFLFWLVLDIKINFIKRILVSVLSKRIVKYFLYAREIPINEALCLIEKSEKIGVTNCICKDCYLQIKEKNCLFFDYGYDMYVKYGPYPLLRITKFEAKNILLKLFKDGKKTIIPMNPINKSIFPQKYCICNCDIKYCMPMRFKEYYNLDESYSKKTKNYSFFHIFIFYISLILCLPLFSFYLLKFINKTRSN